jgi:hypothetical protein
MSHQSVNPATAGILRKFDAHSNQQMFDILAAGDTIYRKCCSGRIRSTR